MYGVGDRGECSCQVAIRVFNCWLCDILVTLLNPLALQTIFFDKLLAISVVFFLQ